MEPVQNWDNFKDKVGAHLSNIKNIFDYPGLNFLVNELIENTEENNEYEMCNILFEDDS